MDAKDKDKNHLFLTSIIVNAILTVVLLLLVAIIPAPTGPAMREFRKMMLKLRLVLRRAIIPAPTMPVMRRWSWRTILVTWWHDDLMTRWWKTCTDKSILHLDPRYNPRDRDSCSGTHPENSAFKLLFFNIWFCIVVFCSSRISLIPQKKQRDDSNIFFYLFRS